jgi:hypothetical protein
MKNYAEAINSIKNKKEGKITLDYEESFALAVLSAQLLRDSPNEGREIIIRVKDVWHLLPENTLSIWNDLTESAGLYPYVDPVLLSKSALLRYEYHTSRYLKSIVLHEEQMAIAQILQNKGSVVLSAPTSFGKSLLIEEVIASRLYDNIVIIQPTLALIDETRKKLLKYKNEYQIILSTTQEPNQAKKSIFIFTGERVIEYRFFTRVDFFIIDEFYKLSLERDDDRAIALNQAFGKLLYLTEHFYLLAPVIKTIPGNFTKKFVFTWYPTNFSTVAVDEKNFSFSDKEEKKVALFNLLLSKAGEQTLIYCSSPQKSTDLCVEFLSFLEHNSDYKKVSNSNKINNIVEWIEKNINPNWSLIKGLKNGIAIHHGGLPRHLGSSIVDCFNSLHIKWLFCTSTLIEGVNTSAKNVILFDKKKGAKPMDYFDYKNIAGRSGRMNQYFIGNVYRFEPEPEQKDIELEIPLFNQETAPLEILVTLEKNQLDDKAKTRMEEYNKLPTELRDLYRKNIGMSISGQEKIIRKIESDIEYYHNYLAWIHTPKSFNEMSKVIELCWENLLSQGDKTYIPKIGRLTARWLASFAYSYVKTQSIQGMIRQYVNDDFWIEKIPDAQERNDIVTYSILHIARHWFDYKLPKWIMGVSNIQEYIFKKYHLSYGNYAFTASNIENGFLSQDLHILTEYDIPITALEKLKNIIDSSRASDENLEALRAIDNEKLKSLGLLDYEISKIKN